MTDTIRHAPREVKVETLTSPYRLTVRASTIMNACGGIPDRITLANPTPATEVAWLAYHVGWHLMFARQALGFFSARGTRSVGGLRWAYIAYRKDRERARNHVRLAGEFLARAEIGYAALSRKRTPA
jgi:hypothetical protein